MKKLMLAILSFLMFSVVTPAQATISFSTGLGRPLENSYSAYNIRSSEIRVPQAKPRWSVQLGRPIAANPNLPVDPTANRSAAAGGRVFYLINEKLQAANLETGKVAWTRGANMRMPIIAGNAYVLAPAEGEQGGVLHKFDAQTGKLLWTFTPRQLSASPNQRVFLRVVVEANRVYTLSQGFQTDTRLTALDLATGKEVWRQSLSDYPQEFHIVKNKLLVGMAESGAITVYTFYAFDKATGQQAWRLSGSHGALLGVRNQQLYTQDTWPLSDSAYQAKLDIVDLETGKIAASREYLTVPPTNNRPISQSTRMLLVDEDLYIQSEEGNIYRFDVNDPAKKDTAPLVTAVSNRMEWLAGPYAGRLFIWNYLTRSLIGIKASNESMIYYEGPKNPLNQMQFDRTGIYVGLTDGELYAVNLLTGKSEFRYQTKGRSFAPFQVADQTLIVEAEDTLYAFTIPKSLLAPAPATTLASELRSSNAKLQLYGKPVTLAKPVMTYANKMYIPIAEVAKAAGYPLTFEKSRAVSMLGNVTIPASVRMANVNGTAYMSVADFAGLLKLKSSWDPGKRLISVTK